MRAKSLISRILHPLDYDQFLDEAVGKRPVALLGEDDGRREHIIGEKPRQAILDRYEDYAPKLTCHIAQPTQPPPKARKVKGPEEFDALVNEFFALGYTVRIPSASDLSGELAAFIRALETVFSCKADTVVFWSGPGARAPVHDDEYDVIALQLHGRKKWFLSNALPSLPNPWKAGKRVPELGQHSTIEVEPGDLLYIPRGTVHTVESMTESIHLSIGFTPVTVRDAIAAALDHCSDGERSLREGVTERAESVAAGEETARIAEEVRAGLKKLVAACESDEFIREAIEWRTSRMICDMAPLPSTPPRPISLDTRLRHHPLAAAKVILAGQDLDFAQPGQHILVHPGAEESLRYIASTSEFTVADIPGPLADDVRIALVQRLVATGFLEVAA